MLRHGPSQTSLNSLKPSLYTDPVFPLRRSSSACIEIKTARDLLFASARGWGWRGGKETTGTRCRILEKIKREDVCGQARSNLI